MNKKNKIQYDLFKELLVQKIIVFMSIYFDSYCRIPADLMNEYHSLFTTKFNCMLKAF